MDSRRLRRGAGSRNQDEGVIAVAHRGDVVASTAVDGVDAIIADEGGVAGAPEQGLVTCAAVQGDLDQLAKAVAGAWPSLYRQR
jgi:hypothetical protein